MNALTRLLTAVANASRRPALRRRLGRMVVEEIEGVSLVVLPQVFNPRVFRSGTLLARTVAALERPPASAARALDLGTGSGVGAIFAARRGYRVVAVDVNPHAVRCARANALLQGLEERIEVRQGDLFAPVAGERFDLVLFNPPFFRGAPGDDLDAAWRSPDAIERFVAGLPAVLAPGGRGLVLLSTDGGADRRLLARTGSGAGLLVEPLLSRDLGNEVLTVFAARLEPDAPPAAAERPPRPASVAALPQAAPRPG
ncbi:MAG TPA: methyltransferase [Thermoanaerobaculia bacterium]|nr:methyltransferase [Thermoanaerobaculia bacterium]